jgi:hypothetical protein
VLNATDRILDLSVGSAVLDLLDAFKTSFVGDELVDIVKHQCKTACVVESASSEPRACLEARAFHFDGLGNVEEAGLFTNLSKRGFSESLLDDDVEKGVHDGVILHFRCCQLFARDVLLALLVDEDLVLNATELAWNLKGFIELGGREH